MLSPHSFSLVPVRRKLKGLLENSFLSCCSRQESLTPDVSPFLVSFGPLKRRWGSEARPCFSPHRSSAILRILKTKAWLWLRDNSADAAVRSHFAAHKSCYLQQVGTRNKLSCWCSSGLQRLPSKVAFQLVVSEAQTRRPWLQPAAGMFALPKFNRQLCLHLFFSLASNEHTCI